MARFFYTFGTDSKFPHGERDYVVVVAENSKEADRKFKEVYPSRSGSNLLNCAFVYNEEQFDRLRDKYYMGIEPIRVINGGEDR